MTQGMLSFLLEISSRNARSSYRYHHTFFVFVSSASKAIVLSNFQGVMRRVLVPFRSALSKSQKETFCSSTQDHRGEHERHEPKSQVEVVNVTVITKDNKKINVRGQVGDNLLYLCHRYDIDMEGACEASLACTTCHCYVAFEYLSKLPVAEEKEEDLLDMAPFLKENSRLGCQIKLTKELDGMEITLPRATRNFYVDGHKPKPH